MSPSIGTVQKKVSWINRHDRIFTQSKHTDNKKTFGQRCIHTYIHTYMYGYSHGVEQKTLPYAALHMQLWSCDVVCISSRRKQKDLLFTADILCFHCSAQMNMCVCMYVHPVVYISRFLLFCSGRRSVHVAFGAFF